MKRAMLLLLFTLPAWIAPVPSGPEDESVFVKNLRPDQRESLLYVWTSDAPGPGALIRLDEQGNFVSALPAPNRPDDPGYMYDVGVKPELNRMVTSSWTHPHHFRANPIAPENVGDAVVVWDWKAGTVLQVEHLDKMPLEVRWQHGPAARGGFINCAGASTIWYWEDKDGKVAFSRVIQLPANSTPADVRISYDNRLLYVSLFSGNAVQQYDVADPLHPKFVSEVKLQEPNMMK